MTVESNFSTGDYLPLYKVFRCFLATLIILLYICCSQKVSSEMDKIAALSPGKLAKIAWVGAPQPQT